MNFDLEFMKSEVLLLKETRKVLQNEEDVNDRAVKDIIIDLVFKNPDIYKLKPEETKVLIENTFLRLRHKLGILQTLAEDKGITEIMVNGPDNIFFEKDGKMLKWNKRMLDSNELEELLIKIAADVKREINELNPIVDARLEDGSRVNGVYKNVAMNGPILTIRKFKEGYLKIEDLVNNHTLTKESAIFLRILVSSGYNIFVSGGTSSGKTTLLNALAEAIPKRERVIVIEDSMELKLPYIENIVHMECRRGNVLGKGAVTMSDLIKSSLRMRPDRIIVGEVRGKEVMDMLNAMNTGHQGSLSTGHGNSVRGMLKRLESMYLMAVPLNIDAIRGQIAEGIDIMIHIEKINGSDRRITEISELTGYEKGEFKLNNLMHLNNENELEFTGNKIQNTHRIHIAGENNVLELRKLALIQ